MLRSCCDQSDCACCCSNEKSNFSAEAIALSLLSQFSEKRLPKASELEWLVSEVDAPQAVSKVSSDIVKIMNE